MNFCKNCGAQLKPGARFCQICGQPVEQDDDNYTSPTPDSNKNHQDQNSSPYGVPESKPISIPKVNPYESVNKMSESDSFVFRSVGLTLKLIFFKKPVKLWGLSLLYILIAILSIPLCGTVPILEIAAVGVLSVGARCIFLNAYNGKEFNSKQLFTGFSSPKKFFFFAGGMLWQFLWILIWLYIPIANIVKFLSYSFTPYILLKCKDISPLDALKRSMKITSGYKMKIFLTYLLVCVIYAIITGIISLIFFVSSLLMESNHLEGLGEIILFIDSILILALVLITPLFIFTLQSAMFTEVIRRKKITDIEL